MITADTFNFIGSVAQDYGMIIAAGIVFLVGFIIGWIFHPFTVGLVTQLLQSELQQVMARVTTAVAFGIGMIFLVGHFAQKMGIQ